MVMTRLAMPGDTITQEHMYVKRSPRLMYALPDDDPGAPLLPPPPALPCPALPAPCPSYAPLCLHYAPFVRPVCAALSHARIMNQEGRLR